MIKSPIFRALFQAASFSLPKSAFCNKFCAPPVSTILALSLAQGFLSFVGFFTFLFPGILVILLELLNCSVHFPPLSLEWLNMKHSFKEHSDIWSPTFDL